MELNRSPIFGWVDSFFTDWLLEWKFSELFLPQISKNYFTCRYDIHVLVAFPFWSVASSGAVLFAYF